MKSNITIAMLSLLVITLSCSKETELKKSVFVPDPEFPDLPAYSEWGYNTFGAYYDREVFIYNDYETPAKVVNTEGKTSFILKGQKGSYNYYSGNGPAEMSVEFELNGFLPEQYADLVALNDSTIDLKNPLCKVIVNIDTVAYEEVILNGTLHFKRAQNLIVDKNQVEVILSGTFEFQALVDDEPISLTLGRFDVGIGMDNFFSY